MDNYIIISVLAFYVLLLLLLFFLRRHRAKLMVAFGMLCWLALLLLGAFKLFASYARPLELEVINYSSKKGQLYFFRSGNCPSRLLYDFAINANEESSLVVEGESGTFSKAVFLTNKGQLFEFPLEEPPIKKIHVWEKELQPADPCFEELIDAYQQRKLWFALATGLLIIGTTFIFAGRSKK